MESLSKNLIQILATLYGVIYFLGFGLPVLMGSYSTDKYENISVLAMFFFFVIGLILSWAKKKIGGILFIIWFIGILILSNVLWEDAGMVLILSIPILIFGIILIKEVNNLKNKSVS